MFIRTRFVIAAVAVGTIFGGTALAQPQQDKNAATTRQRDPQMRRTMRRRGMRKGMAGLRQLNLTDQQRQQMQSIGQAQFQSTQAQRQELRQLMQKRRTGTLTPQDETRATELRRQFMQSRQGVRTQMLGVLTPEQKTQMEQTIKTRRENRLKLGPGNRRII